MSRYKAIFFDRDGTITRYDQSSVDFRDAMLEKWLGRPFSLSYEKFTDIYYRTKALDFPAAHPVTMAEEKLFYLEFYRLLFETEGITEKVEERAQLLCSRLWAHERKLFPETTEVLEYFYNHGYKMGVISDTGVTLEETLINLGAAKYFTSFTSSGAVGTGKPSPVIFNAALAAQNVTAEESIYVDDYNVESDGAREQGFTSFLIDRSGENKNKWTIVNLRQLIDFADSH